MDIHWSEYVGPIMIREHVVTANFHKGSIKIQRTREGYVGISTYPTEKSPTGFFEDTTGPHRFLWWTKRKLIKIRQQQELLANTEWKFELHFMNRKGTVDGTKA